ncbi:aspartyl protease family protein [Lysobacter tyrosinilyticus]
MPNKKPAIASPAKSAVASLALALALASTFFAATCMDAHAAAHDACRLSKAAETDALVHAPFEVVDGRIYVQARVNGGGPYRFAVDTGASGMARADASLVSALGLTLQGQASSSDGVQTATVETTHLAALELGGLARHDLDVITRDYSSRKAPEAAFSGIIAREFFADGLLVIDYPRKVLTFNRSHALSPTDRNVLSYERAFRVPISIGGVQAQGSLDTGANVSFVLPQALYAKVAAGTLEQAGHGQLTNGEIETQRATIHGPFQIGGISVSDVEVRVADRFPELLVGAHVLQNFVLIIDQRSKTIALCR